MDLHDFEGGGTTTSMGITFMKNDMHLITRSQSNAKSDDRHYVCDQERTMPGNAQMLTSLIMCGLRMMGKMGKDIITNLETRLAENAIIRECHHQLIEDQHRTSQNQNTDDE